MLPPRKCRSRYRFYWLLLTVAYGLVNANDKWQVLSDNIQRSLGFQQVIWVSQLFYLLNDGALTSVAVTIAMMFCLLPRALCL